MFDLSNLPYWILLGMGILLYLFIIVSGGGDDDADFDLDADADLDLDVDADADIESGQLEFDTDVDPGSDFSPLQILGWFGVGRAPLMLLLATDLSLWGLLGWMLNVAIAPGLPRLMIDIGVLLVSLILTLFLGGAISRPLGRVFAAFGEDASGDRLIGCIGTISSITVPKLQDGKICQIDVFDSARNLVTVNAALPNWAQVVPQRGDKVLVIDRQEQIYLVIAKDSSDQDQWFSGSSSPRDSR